MSRSIVQFGNDRHYILCPFIHFFECIFRDSCLYILLQNLLLIECSSSTAFVRAAVQCANKVREVSKSQRSNLLFATERMARGNQREVQRERGKKRAEANSQKSSSDHEANKGLTLEQRRARCVIELLAVLFKRLTLQRR